MVDLDQLTTTEARNPLTGELDTLPITDLLTVMNREDRKVAEAVGLAIPEIAAAVEKVADAFRAGGRLIYLGAGTSGRLGVLDAVECPPTFGTDPRQVVGVMAGGLGAFMQAAEGAEDSAELAGRDVANLEVTSRDVVVGIAASGRTPYVIGGLQAARARGAVTVSIACNPRAEVSRHADIAVEVDNGPEVLTGSTRLKAGTSQKLILNMISTAAMVQVGKVYGNLMVDVRPTNLKLVGRAQRIIRDATGCDEEQAKAGYELSGGSAKTAIVMVLTGCDRATAEERLAGAGGFIRRAVSDRSGS